jgi:hypothetical protein
MMARTLKFESQLGSSFRPELQLKLISTMIKQLSILKGVQTWKTKKKLSYNLGSILDPSCNLAIVCHHQTSFGIKTCLVMVKNKKPELQLEFDFESCLMMAKNPKPELQLGFFSTITKLLLTSKIV